VDRRDQEPDLDWPEGASETPARGGAHWLVLLGFIGGTLAMVLLAFVATPDARGHGTHEQLGLSPCRMMQWTGIPCPGCGVTTSVTLAAQGHPWQSFLVQPFGLLTALALPLLTLWSIVEHRRGVDLYRKIAEARKAWIWWTLTVCALAWTYKIVITIIA